MSTMIYPQEVINTICKQDMIVLKIAFEHSEYIAKKAIHSCIINFTNILKAEKGELVPALDLDYRNYIMTFLKFSKDKLSNEQKLIVLSEVILGSNGE